MLYGLLHSVRALFVCIAGELESGYIESLLYIDQMSQSFYAPVV